MSYSNRVYLHSYTHFYTILETLMWSIFEAKCVKVVFYMILHPLMWMLLVLGSFNKQAKPKQKYLFTNKLVSY